MALEDIAGYSLRRGLGSGSVGAVWLVRDLASGRHAVLKRIPAAAVPAIEEFRNDLALAQSIDHPHVTRLIEVRQTEREWLLFNQYVAAGTLTGLLQRRGPLSLGELVTLISPLAQALNAIHRAGLTHGHLGAGDVMFDADGRPVITDAGLRLQATPCEPADDLAALLALAHEAGGEPHIFTPDLFAADGDEVGQRVLRLAAPEPINLGFGDESPPPADTMSMPDSTSTAGSTSSAGSTSTTGSTSTSGSTSTGSSGSPGASAVSLPDRRKPPKSGRPGRSRDPLPTSTPTTPSHPPASSPDGQGITPDAAANAGPAGRSPHKGLFGGRAGKARGGRRSLARATRTRRSTSRPTAHTSPIDHRPATRSAPTTANPAAPTDTTANTSAAWGDATDAGSAPWRDASGIGAATRGHATDVGSAAQRNAVGVGSAWGRHGLGRASSMRRSAVGGGPAARGRGVVAAIRRGLRLRSSAYGLLAVAGLAAVIVVVIGLVTIGVLGQPAGGSPSATDERTGTPEATPTGQNQPGTGSPEPTEGDTSRWLRTLQTLDARRSRAFWTLDAAGLDTVYVPGTSPWLSDRSLLGEYRDRQLRIDGLRLQIENVAIEQPGAETVVLRIVDRLVAGVAVDTAGHRTPLPPGAPTSRRITLTGEGNTWRITAITKA